MIKRFILDGIRSCAYGHYEMQWLFNHMLVIEHNPLKELLMIHYIYIYIYIYNLSRINL